MSHAPIRLRTATLDDAERLLRWRNDPAVRAASLTQAELGLDEHRAWLTHRLADPDCALLIVEDDGMPVGQVRLDREGTTAEVSIGLAPGARGRGLGSATLRAVAREAGRWPEVIQLLAQVREENAASLRAFAAVGFAERSRADGVVTLVQPLG